MRITDLFRSRRVKVYMKIGGKMTKATSQSSGYDLSAKIKTKVTIPAGERALIPTGVYIAMPDGLEAQVRPRSGLAYKAGITVLNTPGTIDADYRGEIGVIMINHSKLDYVVQPDERIAQLVFARVQEVAIHIISDLPSSIRSHGGFGSTGKK